MKGGIFLSYRVSDDEWVPVALKQSLQRYFGEEQVFLDAIDIPKGADFAAVLRERLEASAVLIAIIGEGWLDASNERGRRLDQPDDIVRMEIASALERDGTRVLPVLVEGARMPGASRLPAPLKPLAGIEAHTLRRDPFEHDVLRLVDTLCEHVEPAVSRSGDRDRQNLWREVRNLVEGRLADATRGGALLALRTDSAEAAGDRWEDVPENRGYAAVQSEPTAPIGEIFGDAGRSLLILGEPGAGKTVTMLVLARHLLALARADADEAVPVFLNLSSWRERDGAFLDWLGVEINRRHLLPEPLVRRWLAEGRLYLLIDALDEVADSEAASCVRRINACLDSVTVPGIVIACRDATYRALPTRLKLRHAVRLRPLGDTQIAEFVASLGAEGETLRRALEEDRALFEQAHSPLMLNVMRLASDSPTIHASADRIGTRRSELFASYIHGRFERRPSDRYSPPAVLRWLGWLATRMLEHNQSLLIVGGLQPSWLTRGRERVAYTSLCALGFGVFVALIGAAFWWGTMRLPEIGDNPLYPRNFAVYLAHLPVIATLWSLLSFGLDSWRFQLRTHVDRTSHPRGIRWWLGTFAAFAAVWAAVHLIVFRLSPADEGDLVVQGALATLSGLFVVGFVVSWGYRRRGLLATIETVEALRWSWSGAGRGVLAGASYGLAIAAVFAVGGASLAEQSFGAGLRYYLTHYAAACVVLGFVSLVFSGLTPGMARGDDGDEIDRGMAPALRHALFGGVLSGLWGCLIGSAFWFAVARAFGSVHQVLSFGAVFGLLMFAIAFLWYGGMDLFKHLVLRSILSVRGKMPMRCERFLDHAVELAFLSREGRGYTFFHDLLKRHFAGIAARADMPESGSPYARIGHGDGPAR